MQSQKASFPVFLILITSVCGQELGLPKPKGDEQRAIAEKAIQLLAEGDSLIQATAWTPALSAFEQALALLPDNPMAQLGCGICYEALEQRDKAVAAYRAVAKSRHANLTAVNEGVSRLKQLTYPKLENELEVDYEVATVLLRIAERIKDETRGGGASDLSHLDPLAECIARLNRVGEASPDFAPLYADLGLAYELAGAKRNAVMTYGVFLDKFKKLDVPFGKSERDIRVRHAILLESISASGKQLGGKLAVGEWSYQQVSASGIPVIDVDLTLEESGAIIVKRQQRCDPAGKPIGESFHNAPRSKWFIHRGQLVLVYCNTSDFLGMDVVTITEDENAASFTGHTMDGTKLRARRK